MVNLRPRTDCDRVYTRLMGNLDRSRVSLAKSADEYKVIRKYFFFYILQLCGGGDLGGKGECTGDGGLSYKF